MDDQIREYINQRLIKAIETGIAPWKRPWASDNNVGAPANAVSGRAYSGVNPMLLNLHAYEHGFRSRWWATWNQWHAMGGWVYRRPDDVPPGQWGCRCLFFKPVTKSTMNADDEPEVVRFLIAKSYTLFNAEQVGGPAVDKFRAEEIADGATLFDFAPAEQVIKASGAEIEHGGDSALYIRPEPYEAWPNHTSGDCIVLPSKARFEAMEDYYTTAFHELAHRAEVRLGWDHRVHGYELGELVAEIASCYVAAEIGMRVGNVDQHGAYLRHWLTRMNHDTGYIVRASAQASRVTDYLLSTANLRLSGAPLANDTQVKV